MAAVGLSGQDRQKNAFNFAGASATISTGTARPLPCTARLQVAPRSSQNKRGTQIAARVVAQLAALQGVPTYAIEFLDKEEKADLSGNYVPYQRVESRSRPERRTLRRLPTPPRSPTGEQRVRKPAWCLFWGIFC